jgi:hypothetical protein
MHERIDNKLIAAVSVRHSSCCFTTCPFTSKPFWAFPQSNLALATLRWSSVSVSCAPHYEAFQNTILIYCKAIFTIISGCMITAFGYFTPFVIFGSAFAAVGSGLIYTLDQNSSSAYWIGYQALTGMALGLCLQTPIMAAQAMSAQEDVPATTAILICKSLCPSLLAN